MCMQAVSVAMPPKMLSDEAPVGTDNQERFYAMRRGNTISYGHIIWQEILISPLPDRPPIRIMFSATVYSEFRFLCTIIKIL